MRLQPLNLYCWSKRQFDFIVADRIGRAQPLPPRCIGLRFFNVFGPNEYHKGNMMSIVAKIAQPVSRRERIALFKSHRDGIADGDQRRDIVYVKDAVALFFDLLDRPRMSGIFIIGTDRARSFRELADAVVQTFGRTPAIDYIEMPGTIRPKCQYFTEASLDHLCQIDARCIATRMEDSIARYVGRDLSRNDPYR